VRRAWPRPRLSGATLDRLLAAALLIWALFDVPWWWRPPGHGGSALAILGLLGLAVAQSVPFLWRRRMPAVAVVLTAASLTAKDAFGLNVWSAGVAVLAAAYGLGAYGGRRMRQAARLLAAVAVIAALVSVQASHGSHSTDVACALLATALVLGEVASAHRDIATAAARHAYDLELAGLAREVHDVVAHQLSAIAVRAGAARLASDGDQRAAPDAIAAIEQEARSGLTELNKLVRGMRSLGTADPELPRLSDLPGLVRRANLAGLRAELRLDGEPRPLASPVEHAGYRIVQEGLTNAIRYAPGAAATVRLSYRTDGIVVNVVDDGPGCPPAAPAHQGGGAGLAGLRERARLLGGRVDAGRRPGGGFAVRAFLPGAR
jgi:signal transduction histidine kinase